MRYNKEKEVEVKPIYIPSKLLLRKRKSRIKYLISISILSSSLATYICITERHPLPTFLITCIPLYLLTTALIFSEQILKILYSYK